MIRINGEPKAQVSSSDRGLAYGDGVFRTLPCRAGRLQSWSRHYARLRDDAARLGIVCPNEATWLADIAQLAPSDATIKLTLTRGISTRGYASDPVAAPTRVVQMGALPAYALQRPIAPVEVRLCDWLLPINPGLAGVKHLNRLDQVMARREWSDVGVFDGLMRNARGEVVEGVMSNLFILRGNTLYTHPLQDCGVAGVTRDMVIAAAQSLGVAVAMQAFDIDAFLDADAAILCNSLAGVVPIGACGERRWRDDGFARTLAERVDAMALEESVACAAS
ncbi:aminodeoxychorismate lyase [Chitinimonas sp. BJYL2]|uniref:aminodeoxychorismate lyase n=1 Tax=Chitinimonas sp. BJYL2 TaxID=2976696 RepID=UPI0022B44772|nr:aminodeoxychorismate lyase [Chitinimonas sp. BJYL2]